MPIGIRLRFLDFMDARPLPGGAAVVKARVVPIFATVLGPDPGDNPAEPDHPEVVDEPDDSLAATGDFPVGSTDDSGRVQASLDLGDLIALARSRKRRDPRTDALVEAKDDVEVNLWTDFSFLGFETAPVVIGYDVEDGATVRVDVPMDLASARVGHVTGRSCRLWFALHSPPTSRHRYRLELRTAGARELAGSVPLTFEREADTAHVEFDELSAATEYDYQLVVEERNGDQRFAFARGRFRTPAVDAQNVAMAFASCHLPAVAYSDDERRGAHASLERWQALARSRSDELLLLLGDQIYGDGIEDKWPRASWFERYRNRYRQLWVYWPMREVLRNVPTYMILDDHDVADDFGTPAFDDTTRRDEALRAYEIFQQATNPGGATGRKHYSFRRGPAACFVSEGRVARDETSEFPVLGEDQMDALRDWSRSSEVRGADVIVFATGVPMALLPTEVIRRIADELTEEAVNAATLVAAGVGGVVGGLLGGPGGAVTGAIVGGAVGHTVADEVAERADVDQSLLVEADLAERWDRRENQPDLVRVLDLLFDLGSGVIDGRRRAVFMLAGDIHAGTSHLIRSLHRRHRANPLIWQLTSSAISHEPVNSGLYSAAVSRISDDLDIHVHDFDLAGLFRELLGDRDWESLGDDILDHDVFGDDPAVFTLDPDEGKRYLAEFSGLLMERTLGRLAVRHLGDGRRYEISASVEGRRQAIVHRFELDLDADVVVPVDVARSVRVAVGRVAELRVHDARGGFGPVTDRLDAEAIVRLDTEPGRAFGFTLRPDADEEAHRRMLDTLRKAMRGRMPIRLEYHPTGQRNGMAIRVIAVA